MSGPHTSPCPACGKMGMSTAVAVILVWAPALERPYPLIPAEEYFGCLRCNGMRHLVERAIEAHPVVSKAGRWTSATVVCDGRDGYTLTNEAVSERPTQKGANA